MCIWNKMQKKRNIWTNLVNRVTEHDDDASKNSMEKLDAWFQKP